jgi:spermidine synthase
MADPAATAHPAAAGHHAQVSAVSSGRTSTAAPFVAASFASAFLIFLVQPLVAKRIVPWFGGVPAVWSVCLAFYQTSLFAGYAYAHVLIRRASPGAQLAVHAVLVAAAALALPVLPEDTWQPTSSAHPSAAILAALVANVALPFAALAATGPLVAAWFSRRYPDRSPYPLYAVSNAGSLLALLAFPFAIEPRLALSTTSRVWSVAFVVTGAAVLACAELARRGARGAVAPEAVAPLEATRVTLWILLSACAVALLTAATNELCLDVASVPFLWIVPLATYLVTLILCFGTARIYRRTAFVALSALGLFGPAIAQWFSVYGALQEALGGPIVFQEIRYALVLFGMCMVLHGELYRLRPPAGALTAFYLCVAGGGALGGLAVGLLAPRVFDKFYELTLALALAWLLLLAACRNDDRGWLGRSAPRWHVAAACLLTVAGFVYFGRDQFARSPHVLYRERSFFGVLRVEQGRGDNPYHSLMHGSTMHGVQFDRQANRPTSYYGVQSGIGIALRASDSDPPREIGVIGLGAGTIAAYGRANDHIRFFEIDPAVIRIARNGRFFTYLSQSPAKIDILEGDGRILLARERARNAPRFDVLAIDAYASDAVPVHLLTREAIALYLDMLEPDGLLAVHTSSRYFDVMPVLARIAHDAGVDVMSVETAAAPRYFTGPSSWVFLARDAERLRYLERETERRQVRLGLGSQYKMVRHPSPAMIEGAPLWTDDYSNLYRALARNGSRPLEMGGGPAR